jgi:hypothetical protein
MIRTEQTEICLKFTEKFKFENAKKSTLCITLKIGRALNQIDTSGTTEIKC